MAQEKLTFTMTSFSSISIVAEDVDNINVQISQIKS